MEAFAGFARRCIFFPATASVFLCESLLRARRRHALSEAKVVSILDNMGECFCSLDRNWRVIHVNRRALSYLGFGDANLKEQTFWELLPQVAGPSWKPNCGRAMTKNVAVRFEAFGLVPHAWVEINATSSPDGLAVFFQDITTRKTQLQQLEQEVAERTGELQETVVDLEAFSTPSCTTCGAVASDLQFRRDPRRGVAGKSDARERPPPPTHRARSAPHGPFDSRRARYSQLGRARPELKPVDCMTW